MGIAPQGGLLFLLLNRFLEWVDWSRRQDGYRELNHFKPPEYWAKVRFRFPDLIRVVVARDDDEVGANLAGSAFVFGQERITVTPDFKVVAELVVVFVQVFNEDCFFVGVAVPPLVAHFKVSFRKVGTGFAGFAGSAAAIVPEVLGFGVGEVPGFCTNGPKVFNGTVAFKSDVIGNIVQSVFAGSQSGVFPARNFFLTLYTLELGWGAILKDVTVFLNVGHAAGKG